MPRRRRAHELFEEEGVAGGLLDDRIAHGRARARTDRVDDERPRSACGQRAEVNLQEASLGEHVGHLPRDLGARRGDHEERRVHELGERGVEKIDGRSVGPLQIVDRDDDGPPLRERTHEEDPRFAHHVGHERRVGARRAKLGRSLVGRRVGACDLAEDRLDPSALLTQADTFDHRADLRGARSIRIRIGDASPAVQQIADDAERRSGSHRIGVGRENLDACLVAEAAETRFDEPRFPHPRVGDDHDDARARLGNALVERRGQRCDLVRTTNAGCGLAEEGARRPCARLFADELAPVAIAAHDEAVPEEIRRRAIDDDDLLGIRAEGFEEASRRAIDDLADLCATHFDELRPVATTKGRRRTRSAEMVSAHRAARAACSPGLDDPRMVTSDVSRVSWWSVPPRSATASATFENVGIVEESRTVSRKGLGRAA